MAELTFEQMLEAAVKNFVKDSNGSDDTGPEDVYDDIYDDIYDDVMREVWENLSRMKPKLIQEVSEKAAQEVADKYEQKINQLEQRIAEMEKLLSEGERGNKTIGNVRRSVENISKSTARIDVSKICGPTFRFAGWIYYTNKKMGDFLYKVREDGSGNTQLTDYSVAGHFSVSQGYLHFWDTNLEDKKIKLG